MTSPDLTLWLSTTPAAEVERQRVRAMIHGSISLGLPAEFTVTQLRRAADLLQGTEHKPDAFRRSVLPYLTPTGTLTRGDHGKPAALYTYQPDDF